MNEMNIKLLICHINCSESMEEDLWDSEGKSLWPKILNSSKLSIL